MDSFDYGWRPMARLLENGNEASGSRKYGEMLY